MKNSPDSAAPAGEWPRAVRSGRSATLVRSASLLLCAAAVVFAGCKRHTVSENGQLVLSGNIEVVDAQVSFKIPGRVAQRLVSEGDEVKAGQPVAQLDNVDQVAQLALRSAELAGANAAFAELVAGSRPQEITSAEATLHSAEAERDRARIDFTRQQELLKQAAISQRDFDTAQAQLRVTEARVIEAAERLKLVKEGPRVETVRQARARVEQAWAAVSLAQAQLDYTKLASPLTGVVLSHNIEAGEYVSPGTPVITVADTRHVWVRAYLDQTDLGRVKRGEQVEVRTDSFPNKTYKGVVGFISSEAEFTPKTVQTPKERVKLVFRIKVDIANENDELKPGMPADVLIP